MECGPSQNASQSVIMRSTASSAAPSVRTPDRSRAAVLSESRRAPWHVMLGLAAAAKIVFAARRIGADDYEIGARHEALVTGALRKHDDIAGRDVDRLAVVTAEAHLGVPARDGHRLVDHRMIVDVGVNAVAPHVAPAVRREDFFDDAFRVG